MKEYLFPFFSFGFQVSCTGPHWTFMNRKPGGSARTAVLFITFPFRTINMQPLTDNPL